MTLFTRATCIQCFFVHTDRLWNKIKYFCLVLGDSLDELLLAQNPDDGIASDSLLPLELAIFRFDSPFTFWKRPTVLDYPSLSADRRVDANWREDSS